MDYTSSHVAVLLQSAEDIPTIERWDIEQATKQLHPVDRTFVQARLEGHSLRKCGKIAGVPGHTSRRYRRICNKLSSILGGAR